MRPALRLAWREIVRHRWRSLLVTVLIGLPIMASVATVTLIETSSISSDEARPYTFGAAQARVEYSFNSPADDGGNGGEIHLPTTAEAVSLIHDATAMTVIPSRWGNSWVTFGDQTWRVDTVVSDFTSPLANGLSTVTSGRLPRTADEVAISPHLRHRGVKVGDRISVANTPMTVVGVARTLVYGTSVPEDAVLLPAGGPADAASGEASLTFLVGSAQEKRLTQEQISALSRQGYDVTPRHADVSYSYGTSSEDNQLIALLITCLLIEIVLLAGPAFAVGVRRQQRTLALVAIAGGDPRQIRRVVLLQGLILGFVASLLGAAVSVPVVWIALRVLEARSGLSLGPFDVGTVAFAPAIALGTLSAVIAALIPARQASRAHVVTALAGRQPTPTVTRGWPILGVVVLAVGTLGSLTSLGRWNGDLANAWWAVVSVCGAVLLTPWLISAIARLAPRLPLALRLAVRDADRHRSRSAPAVAAVMASVAAVVALGIGGGSDARANDRDQFYPYPLGTVLLSDTDATSLTALVDGIKQRTGVTFTPLATLDSAYVNTSTSGLRFDRSNVVADAATLHAWGVDLSNDAIDALNRGDVLVDKRIQNTGAEDLWEWWDENGNAVPGPDLTTYSADLTMAGDVPAGADVPSIAAAVMSPQTAIRAGLSDRLRTDVAIADATSPDIDLGAIRQAANDVDPMAWSLDVTSKERSDYWLILLLLTGLGAFTVLLGTFSATGLALNDARPDMETLSAVGARPRSRRAVAGSHAFLIAFLGVLLGIVVGFTPGLAASWLLTAHDYGGGWVFVVPWPLLAVLLIGVPLAAGLITALVSRTSIRATRRTA